jgi:TolA-binding protein
LEQLIQDYPESTLRLAAEYWIAEAHYRQDHFDEADAILTQLASRSEGRADAWLAMVPLRQAQIRVQQARWQEALELVGSIAERFPNFSQQHEVDYVRGRCLSSQARFQEAREVYERVIIAPGAQGTETAAMAQWMIGETWFHQKQYSDAVRAYHRVESLYAYPRWQAAALLQAGKCYELLGKSQQAMRTYQQIMEDFSESAFAGDAAKRLEQLRVMATHNADGEQPTRSAAAVRSS